MHENVEKFVNDLASSLRDNTFVKLTLGNYKGADEHLQKILVRLIKTRKGVRLFFLYRYETRDTAKNYEIQEGIDLLREILGSGFRSGHLFTTHNDLQLDIGKKGRARLNVSKPTFTTRPSLEHDREKSLQIDPSGFYLTALGITNDHGLVRDKQQDKWRQINKFVEILSGLVERSTLKDRPGLTLVDMGSGKGYLTFAAYDYFKNIKGIDVSVTGVDTRKDLVELCSDVARSSEFDGLKFVRGSIEDLEVDSVDLLIALHACNTATDDAIFKGISAGAEIIIVAPCCHHELRPQISPPEVMKDVLKHPVMMERVAETLTDGLRSMLLETAGYSTRIFEFVSVEHTPKNNMIVAVKQENPPDPGEIEARIAALMEYYAIREQRLHSLLYRVETAGSAAQAR
jgi:SAM-dependent methyltransferase